MLLWRIDMTGRTLGGLALFLFLLTVWVTPREAFGQKKSDAKAIELKTVAAPYATNHDKPLEAKEEVVNEADDHTQYRVEFNGIKGDRVPAYLYVPKRKAAAAKIP